MNEKLIKEAALRFQKHILQPFDEMIKLDTFDSICFFLNEYGGSNVYIPKLKTVFGDCLEMEAARRYNGSNYREIVRLFDFSDRTLQRLINK